MKKIKILSILLASSLTLGSGLLPSYSPLMAAEKDQTQTAPVTVTPDPALGAADVRKDLPQRFFQTQSEGGTVSQNISQNNYKIWGNAVNSFIEENEDGSFLRIEQIDSELIVEKYDSDFKKAELVTKVSVPLPIYGGYFTGENARFLVCGESNPEESNEKEVVRIIKYDNDWNELDYVSVYGANTYNPFGSGILQMTEMNGILYITGCHTMYAADDGVHHQASMNFAVNEENMELITQNTEIGCHGYVSHSFCQRIAQDGTDIYLFDHGDGYPRSAYLQKIDAKLKKVSKVLPVIKFNGKIGANETGASIGGIEIVSDNIFTAGNSVEQFGEVYEPSTYKRNLWVSVIDKKMENQIFVWLTDHENLGEWSARTPYLIPASDGSCYVMWEDVVEIPKSINGYNYNDVKQFFTKIAKVKPDGTIDGEIHTIYGRLSDCKPIVTSDQKLVWYTTEKASPLFYSLDLNQLSSYEFTGYGNIEKCSVTISAVSYNFYDPSDNKTHIGPEVLSVNYGDLKLTEGVDYNVSYNDNADMGTGYIQITGKGFFEDPATDTADKILRIPYQINYPTEPEDTEEPTGTPYQEPSWFVTGTPATTRKPSATKKPGTSSSPAATKKPVTSTAPKKTSYPKRTAKPASSSAPVAPEKMTGISPVNLKGKKMMITWTKQDNVSGYQLQYAMNKKFTLKKKTLSCSKYRSMKLVSGLKKNKTYYVRMRAYVQTDSGNLYGKWSKKVKCKIKK